MLWMRSSSRRPAKLNPNAIERHEEGRLSKSHDVQFATSRGLEICMGSRIQEFWKGVYVRP